MPESKGRTKRPAGAKARAGKTAAARAAAGGGAARPKAKGRAASSAGTGHRAAIAAAAPAAPQEAPAAGAKSRHQVRLARTWSRTVIIQQFASGIQCPVRQKRILRSLGLKRPHQKVVRPDNEAIRGMVAAIPHLVRIVEEQDAR